MANYEGQRNEKGEKHGFGIMLYNDGCMYRGQFQHDRAHGVGEFDWGDGNKYIGEFKLGKQEGFGVYCWPTGGSYEGQWKNDRMNGTGTYRRNDGVMYVGEWKEDHQFSEGTRIHPERICYGKQKKMERRREIRERWNDNKDCIYSKEISLYPDMWTILNDKQKFVDLEIICVDNRFCSNATSSSNTTYPTAEVPCPKNWYNSRSAFVLTKQLDQMVDLLHNNQLETQHQPSTIEEYLIEDIDGNVTSMQDETISPSSSSVSPSPSSTSTFMSTNASPENIVEYIIEEVDDPFEEKPSIPTSSRTIVKRKKPSKRSSKK